MILNIRDVDKMYGNATRAQYTTRIYDVEAT